VHLVCVCVCVNAQHNAQHSAHLHPCTACEPTRAVHSLHIFFLTGGVVNRQAICIVAIHCTRACECYVARHMFGCSFSRICLSLWRPPWMGMASTSLQLAWMGTSSARKWSWRKPRLPTRNSVGMLLTSASAFCFWIQPSCGCFWIAWLRRQVVVYGGKLQ